MQTSKTLMLIFLGLLVLISIAQARNSLTQSSTNFAASTSAEEKTAATAQVYASWIRPPSRSSANLQVFSNEICGGSVAESVHMITTQEYPNRFEWYIHTAIPDSSCQIRISQVGSPKEKDFTVLRPSDHGPINADGSFPCGKAGPAVESRQFTFPLNVSCDHCVLEWVWKTPKGNVRQCSDLIITSGAEAKCLGMCQNGGVCSKSHCVCPKGYSGDYCQYQSSVGGGFKKFLIGVFICIVIAILVFGAFYLFAKYRVNTAVSNKIYQDYHVNSQQQPKFQPFEDERH